MTPDLDTALEPQRSWWGYAGPWPLRPVLVFIVTWYFFNVTTVGAITVATDVGVREFFVDGMAQGFVSAVPLGLTLWLGRRWQMRNGVRWRSYLSFVFLGALLVVAVRYFVFLRPVVDERGESSLVFAFFRLTILVLVALALAGAVTERLQRQVNATTKALEVSRRQQAQILQADENARRQVAELLHDRVQAGLITACMELQSLPVDDEERRTAVAATIRQLETLRSIDVRRAARALSPSLQDVDLHAALRELGAQYEPTMRTTVDVSSDVEQRIDDPEIRLAIYRIAEQALMNSASHGRARNVDISVRISGPTLTMDIHDDGVGLRDQPRSDGLGSALITTWARKLGGQWSLLDGAQGGAVLRLQASVSSAVNKST